MFGGARVLGAAIAVLVSCGGSSRPIRTEVGVPAARPAERPKQTADVVTIEACPDSSVRSVAVGANEVVWWCRDSAIRMQRFAGASVESIASLTAEGRLAIDAANLWVSHIDPNLGPTLYRAPLSGGPLVNIGPAPAELLVPHGDFLLFLNGGSLARVPKSGGAPLVIVNGGARRFAADGKTIVFVEPRYGGRSAVRMVDATLKVTTVVPDILLPSPDLVAGGGWAYLFGGIRVDLQSGEVDYAWKCRDPVIATSERVVMRCADNKVHVAAHGRTETTVVADVPGVGEHLFGGPDHICWVTGDAKRMLACAMY